MQEFRWEKLNLRSKATVLLVAIATLPLLGIGAVSYYLAGSSFTEQIQNAKKQDAREIADKINNFMFQRYADIQILANLPFLTDSRQRANVSTLEKQQQLNRFIHSYKVYDSIAVFDLNGNVIVQSEGPALANRSNENYFQQVLRTHHTVVSQPEVSSSSGNLSIRIAAPVVDRETGKIIAVVRTRMPVNYLENVVQIFGSNTREYYLTDSSGKCFVATKKNHINRNLQENYPQLANLLTTGQPGTLVTFDKVDKVQKLLAYARTVKFGTMPDLNWSITIATDTATAFEIRQKFLLILVIGTLITALIVAILATLLADRITRPLRSAAKAVAKIGQGELQTRLNFQGEDELALLAFNINRMAKQFQLLLEQQAESQQRQTEEELLREKIKAQEEISRVLAENVEKQRFEREKLQKQAIDLLKSIDPIIRGDLTIRTQVTADQIGTLADSYNAIVSSFQRIVKQVKSSANALTQTAGNQQVAITNLSNNTQLQVEAITPALEKVEVMVDSIRVIAAKAKLAERQVLFANQNRQAIYELINQIVSNVPTVGEMMSSTTNKMRYLGNSTQEITKTVKLINDFADQCNLLALNAELEAAREEEQNSGFSFITDEVRKLASQSAIATEEMTRIVEKFQQEVLQAVTATEANAELVAFNTQEVSEKRKQLIAAIEECSELNTVSLELCKATAKQEDTLLAVSTTIQYMVTTVRRTQEQSQEVASIFSKILEIAQELEQSVGQFRVN